jgi:spermidine synthase
MVAENQQAVAKQLEWLWAKPEGVLYAHRSPLHRIVISRDGTLIRMFFLDPKSGIIIPDSSGAMSAMDLRNPFDLSPTPYNQAMMLALLWNDSPQRAYALGFAGGRIPFMLYHHFPSIVVDSTDIDPDVRGLAARYFGVEYDQRQKLFIQDGREFLENLKQKKSYDFIFADAFRGTGFSPFHLSTIEFYDACKRHLADGGVVSANWMESDPLFTQKLLTLSEAFRYVYVQIDRTVTAFGSDTSIETGEDCRGVAEDLAMKHGFAFPFRYRARTLTPLMASRFQAALHKPSITVLRDREMPDTIKQMPKDDSIFHKVGRNELCPCGSGRKYKKCHGK